LKYAKWTGSSWSIETVDSSSWVEKDTSIALDTNDHPHISYYNDDGHDLKYAEWSGSWSIEIVDSNGNVGLCNSLALDTNNHPHISYYYHDGAGHNLCLKYAERISLFWSIETVDSNGDVGPYSSLALDKNNYPHISYYNQSGHNLKYAKWTGSSWSIETVDSNGDVGYYTSIALDKNNYPHISYYDTINYDLKYAMFNPNEPPIANFTFTVDELSVTFNASSSYDPDGNIKNWFWVFGDGTGGVGETITHNYLNSGIYNVTLTVADDEGALDSLAQSITVEKYQGAFIFGKITNFTNDKEYIQFQAVKTRVLTLNPFSFNNYLSGEKFSLSKDYKGLIGVQYIFALCKMLI
jgi:PKD repeat protein